MASTAARVFFCRPARDVRSTVLTGFLTGAAVCPPAAGAAGEDGAAVCAGAELAKAHAKPSVRRILFILSSLLLFDCRDRPPGSRNLLGPKTAQIIHPSRRLQTD